MQKSRIMSKISKIYEECGKIMNKFPAKLSTHFYMDSGLDCLKISAFNLRFA